jgi:hypothetical protein
MIDTDLFTWLCTTAGHTRVYPGHMPQEVDYPAIVYTRISAPRELTHSAPDTLVLGRFQLDFWGETHASVRAAADTIRQSLNGYKATMGSTIIGAAWLELDQDDMSATPHLFRVINDYFIYFKE